MVLGFPTVKKKYLGTLNANHREHAQVHEIDPKMPFGSKVQNIY